MGYISAWLSSYVDSNVLRDVIERHAIRLNRLHGVLKSQGLAISREHLAELVVHVESGFLIQFVGA